jgi:hypothetical protein
MLSIRSVATVLGFAALTSAATLTVFWPKATFADGPNQDLVQDGTKVNHVVIDGEVVRDKKAKTGWVIEVTAENRGTEAETAELETDLQRVISNPMSRAAPMPTAVMKKKETITVAAGEKVTKRYAVPAAFAAQMTAQEAADTAREKAEAKGKFLAMPRSVTYFSVAFKGKWTDDAAPQVANRNKLANVDLTELTPAAAL